MVRPSVPDSLVLPIVPKGLPAQRAERGRKIAAAEKMRQAKENKNSIVSLTARLKRAKDRLSRQTGEEAAETQQIIDDLEAQIARKRGGK